MMAKPFASPSIQNKHWATWVFCTYFKDFLKNKLSSVLRIYLRVVQNIPYVSTNSLSNRCFHTNLKIAERISSISNYQYFRIIYPILYHLRFFVPILRFALSLQVYRISFYHIPQPIRSTNSKVCVKPISISHIFLSYTSTHSVDPF